MADLVVCISRDRWDSWIADGDLPGDPWSGERHGLYVRYLPGDILPGERVYIQHAGVIRGYAPLLTIFPSIERASGFVLVRGGGARAVTPMCVYPGRCPIPPHAHAPHPRVFDSFPGARLRSWEYLDEWAFPGWRTF